MTEPKDGTSGGATDVIPDGSSETKMVDSDSQGSDNSTSSDLSIPLLDHDMIRKAQSDSVVAAEQLVMDNVSLQQRLAEAEARIAELEGDNVYLTEEYVGADRNLRKAEANLGDAQNALSELNSEYDMLVTDNQEIVSTSLQFRHEYERLNGRESELLDKISQLESGLRDAKNAGVIAGARADRAEFKVILNEEVDDVKETYSRESLEVRVKAMMREVAIPTFNVDFAAAAFMDNRYSHPDIVCEHYELLPEFFMREFLEERQGFIDKLKDDAKLFNWFLSDAFTEAFDCAVKDLATSAYSEVRDEYRKDNPDADSGMPVAGSPEVEDMKAELNAELNGLDSAKEMILKGLTKYIIAHMDHVQMPLDVNDRGLIGVLIAGRKRGLPKSLSYSNGLDKGVSIRESFRRDQPLDTPEMKEYWNVFCEQIDDMAAAYKDERSKDSLARYLEEKFGKNPFTSATIDGPAETLGDMGISDIFIVFYDEDKKDDSGKLIASNLRRQCAGPDDQVIDRLQLERLMHEDYSAAKAEIETSWTGAYHCEPITSGDDIVGRVFALKEGADLNQFEKSTLSVLANNLGRKVTQHYKQLREHRIALSKKVALRVIDEGRDLGRTVRGSMSVLYADVCGFTKASEVIDPADMTSILNLFFENSREITDSLDITHDKTIGDCTMELVGPPYLDFPPQEKFVRGNPVEYASRGVECLLQFRERLAILNELYFQNPEHLKCYGEAAQEYLRCHPVKISMGIASGIADFCKLGASTSPDFTAVGPVVNLASRVEGFADADQIAVCPETFLLLTTGKVSETRTESERVIPLYTSEGILSHDGRYVFTPIGKDPVNLKGVDKPQRLYEVNRNTAYVEKR
ncbi:MAG: adenylate/guanylate cyclase domain-containing protein [Candidatus Woesearchaeota archaeon]